MKRSIVSRSDDRLSYKQPTGEQTNSIHWRKLKITIFNHQLSSLLKSKYPSNLNAVLQKITLTYLESYLWKPRNCRIPFNAAYIISATYTSIGCALPMTNSQLTIEWILINRNIRYKRNQHQQVHTKLPTTNHRNLIPRPNFDPPLGLASWQQT